jgi:hypothetical protein
MMARMARLIRPGMAFHLVQRGNHRHDPETWRKALELGQREAAFAERLRQATERRRPLGPVAFLEDLELRLKRSVRPQRRGRKPEPGGAEEGLPNCVME